MSIRAKELSSITDWNFVLHADQMFHNKSLEQLERSDLSFPEMLVSL
jgi:hypothetical protein